jgi:molybdopterin synthase catalytic subunit
VDKDFAYHITFGNDTVSDEVIESFLRLPNCGAEVVFKGIIRNDVLLDNDAVVAIEYEGIEGMIHAEVETIAKHLYQSFQIRRFFFHHIIGRVPVGQPSIWIGIAGGHRKEVFQALDLAMDQIKSTVPIFKKEMGTKNQVWK